MALLVASASVEPTWLTLLGVLGTGALGATVVQAVVSGFSGRSQRRHEASLRQTDRDHELRVQQLADERARRDHREGRIYSNLEAMAELMVHLGARVELLRSNPSQCAEPSYEVTDALAKVMSFRASMVLDAETEPLIRLVKEAEDGYAAYLLDLKTAQLRRPGQPSLPEDQIQRRGSCGRSRKMNTSDRQI